jgi:uncharacterized protein with FMN-binding domain
MRRAALAIAGTVTALVMLLSFKSHSNPTLATPPAAVGATGEDDTAGTASPPGGATSAQPTTQPTTQPTARPTARTGTFTGAAVDTRFGPVQVQISVKDGRLAGVTAIQYPTESRRDQEINAYAIPALTQEALTANGAGIDMISGATFTSQGYISSLQSALDQAGS